MGEFSQGLQAIANGIGQGIQSFASHSAQAANNANGVSFASQAAQGNFNQASANNANSIAAQRIADQYAYNAAQAAYANDFTNAMWDKSAAWNEMMWERQASFNREEAEKNRQWQEYMSSTAYQRAVKDLETAGLNPILAATGGLVAPSVGSAQASISGASMGTAQGAMSSGGLLQGSQASEGNFTGQMEYMGGVLGLISSAMAGISSAVDAMAALGSDRNDFKSFIGSIFSGDWEKLEKDFKNPNTKFNQWRQKNNNSEYRNGVKWRPWANDNMGKSNSHLKR